MTRYVRPLAVRDPGGPHVERGVESQSEVRLVARQPARQPRLQHEIVAVDGRPTQPPVEITVDAVVLLGEFAQLHQRQIPLGRDLAERVATREVVQIERRRHPLGARGFARPRWPGDRDQHTPTVAGLGKYVSIPCLSEETTRPDARRGIIGRETRSVTRYTGRVNEQPMRGEHAGTTGRILITVGRFALGLERYYPGFVRRNLGLRLFLQAAMVIVVAPAAGVVLFDSVAAAAATFVVVTLTTGFLGYCELYWVVVRLTDETHSVADGEFDVAFEIERHDEIGALLDGFTEMAAALRENVREAETARERAAERREEAADRSAAMSACAERYGDVMDRAAAGDLTARIEPETDIEAMARVGESFDETVAALADTVGQADRTATRIAAAGDRAADGVRAAEAAAREVDDAASDISTGTDDQSARLGEVTEEMASLSATVEEVASTADQIAGLSGEAADRGERGAALADDALDEMDRIAANTTETAETIGAVAEDLDRVEEIVELIDSVAEQTNTLALNASIEAARANGAGDAGDGFAVVAEEVKTLADETREATDRVAGLVADVRASMDEAVATARETDDRVDRGRDQVERAVDAVEETLAAVEETNDAVQSISTATEDQAATAEEVVAMAEEVADLAETTAQQADAAAAATHRQTDTLDDVRSDVAELADEATDLDRLTDEFELPERPTTADAGRVAAPDGGR